jgi:hypothetical protein
MYPYDSGVTNALQQQTNDLIKSFQQQIVPQQAERHTVKVNGRAGAESYNLPPNSDELLLDMNAAIIWFVQTDGAGYKTVTPYDISLHKEVKQEDVIKSMEDRITKLEEAMRNGKSNTSANYSKPKSGYAGNDAGGRSNDKG